MRVPSIQYGWCLYRSSRRRMVYEIAVCLDHQICKYFRFLRF